MNSPSEPAMPVARSGLKIVAWLLPLLLVLGWFSPWWLQGKVMAPFDILPGLYEPWRTSDAPPEIHNHFSTDAVCQYVPYRQWAEKSLREDGYLGWNPYVFGGTPQYANTMVTGFDWGMWLHDFAGFWTVWHIVPMVQLIIAGSGMLLLLKARGAPYSIAALAAVAFMANWQFITCLYFRQILSCFCWMPWVLWALSALYPSAWNSSSVSRPSWRPALAPFFLCLAFLGGTLQQHAFIVIVLGCVGMGLLLDRALPVADRWWRLVRLTLLAGLALCLAAFMLEPTIQTFLDNLQSGQKRGGIGYEHGWIQPLLNLFALPFYAFPFPLGRPQTLDLWKLLKTDFMNVGFYGTLPVLAAIAATFSRKVLWGPRLMILAGLLIPLTPLVGPLYHRVNIVWIMGGCWAGAELLSASSKEDLHQWSRRLVRLSMVLLCIWLAMSLVLLLFEKDIIQRLQEYTGGRAEGRKSLAIQQWIQERSARFPGELMLWHPWQLIPVVGMLISFSSLKWIRMPHIKAFLPALGVAVQLSATWVVWTTWSEERKPYDAPLGMSQFKELIGHGRLELPTHNRREPFLPPNTSEPAGIAILGGYDSIHPLGISRNSDNPLQSTDGVPVATHILTLPSETSPPGWNHIGDFWGHQLWKHPYAASTAFFRGENESLLQSLTWKTWTMNRRQIDLSSGSGEVVIAETWHRDWRYRTGSENWLVPAKGPDRSIRIPVSLNAPATLEMRFFPHSTRWPLWLSGAALLFALGHLSWQKWQATAGSACP